MLSKNLIYECDHSSSVQFDLNEILNKKNLFIKTKIQHDFLNRFDYEDFWRSTENEGEYYINLLKNKNDSMRAPLEHFLEIKIVL